MLLNRAGICENQLFQGGMNVLVLSRKCGEHVLIGEDTVIVIRSIGGNRVRIAIDAPQTTRILRGELARFEDYQNATNCELELACKAPRLTA